MRVNLIKTNFTAGELSPRLMGRVDIARYANGARTIQNGVCTIQGGVMRRPGMQYIAATKYTDKKARLIPFVFNHEQSYIIELGDGYARIYQNGNPLKDRHGQLLELKSPYREDQLAQINFTQGADTLFMVHPDVRPQRLQRQKDVWVFESVNFAVEPSDDADDSTPHVWCTPSARGPAGTEITLTLSGSPPRLKNDDQTPERLELGWHIHWPWRKKRKKQTPKIPPRKTDPPHYKKRDEKIKSGWSDRDLGAYVRINQGLLRITQLDWSGGGTSDGGQCLIVKAEVIVEPGSAVAAQPGSWTREYPVWTDASGYPSAVALYQQRLVMAGTRRYPATVWFSETEAYLSFAENTHDDDALSFTLAADQVNPVVHLTQMNTLLALTYGGEFTINSGKEGPVTPTSISVKNPTPYGCSHVRPVRVGTETLFVQRAGKKLYAIACDPDTLSGYVAIDLSLLSEHLTASGLTGMACQQQPDAVVWGICNNGHAVSISIDRAQEVVAWTQHETDGQFEAVASVPGPEGDVIYFLVRREIRGRTVRYIEALNPHLNTDAAFTASGPEKKARWEGLHHLEGKTVDVVADGIVAGPLNVSRGAVTLPFRARSIEAGLHYETVIETLTPEIPTPEGTVQNAHKRTSEVTLRFLNTASAECNGQPVSFSHHVVKSSHTASSLFTGDCRIGKLGWSRHEDTVVIKQTLPLPFHLLAVIQTFTCNGG